MARPNRHALRGQTIGIIGLGTMGSAIAKGLLAHGRPRARVLGAEARAAQRRDIARALRLRVSADVAAVVRRSHVVLLAVKPQELAPVLEILRRARHPRQRVIVSIAAGITTRCIEQRAGHAPVIRAMPNTAARVGQSIVALARGRFATRAQLRLAQALFQSVGKTVEAPERLMDAVTAVSGSGPAYFFWLTDQLAQAGVAVGLPRATANRLARQTAIGSAALLARSDESPAALIAQVTSKRGTTEAALRVFAQRHMAAIVREAVRAATRRAKELSCSS